MCGIVGLFLKDRSMEGELGGMLTDMLVTMSDRGPDSAGIAVYRGADDGKVKFTLQTDDPEQNFRGLNEALGASVQVIDTHAIVSCAQSEADEVRQKIRENFVRDHQFEA